MSSAGRGVVATSHPLASEAGARLLRAGGNAVDAAAAVQFALNVVEPLASGIGGGAFTLIRPAAGETFVVDSRERAPAAATADLFLDSAGAPLPWDERSASGKAVAVPGTLMGLAVALARWGSRSLAEVVQPAVELAESAVLVSGFMAGRLQQQVAKLRLDPTSAGLYLPGGEPLREGDALIQPDLARTLRLIADGGPDVFYQGEIASAMVEAVAARGGAMTLDDLASYQVEWRSPVVGAYRGVEVATAPPPGAGVALLEALRLLESFDLAALGPLTTARAHLELQAMRLALLDRVAYLGDPLYADVPVQGLLDPKYLDSRRKLIQPGSLGPEPAAGRPDPVEEAAPLTHWPETGQTTHFTVLDRWGNLVCCTSTIEDFFGSGISVPGYGFLLNNEMTDFNPEPGGPNEIRPLARPSSSMAPTLLSRDGKPWLALGSPGGPTIMTTVLQVILRVVDEGLPLQAAIDLPRIFASRFPRLTWELDMPAETLEGLRALGHRPAQRPTTIGSVQAIMLDDAGMASGAADPRRDGSVIYVDA